MDKRVTSKDMVVLFYRLLREKFELPAIEYHRANFARDCVFMKQRIISFFAEHGYELGDVEAFIRWFFGSYLSRQRTREVPHIGWLPGAILGFFVDKNKQVGVANRYIESALNSDREFFGRGCRHGEHDFTKWEYWLGFWWRRSNLSDEEIARYRIEQADALISRFGELEAGVHLYRFTEWESDYLAGRQKVGGAKWSETMWDIFVKVQARRRSWTVERVREHYGLDAK